MAAKQTKITSTSKPAPSQDKDRSLVSEQLTPAEIESLRQDLKEKSAYAEEALARLKAERARRSPGSK